MQEVSRYRSKMDWSAIRRSERSMCCCCGIVSDDDDDDDDDDDGACFSCRAASCNIAMRSNVVAKKMRQCRVANDIIFRLPSSGHPTPSLPPSPSFHEFEGDME